MVNKADAAKQKVATKYREQKNRMSNFMKKIILIILLVSALYGCKTELNDGYICRCLQFQTSSNNGYWVEVFENRTVKISYGEIDWDFRHAIDSGFDPDYGISWERIKAVDSLTLDYSIFCNFQIITEAIKRHKSVNLHPVYDYDGRGIALFVKDKQFYYTSGDYKNKSTKDLIHLLDSVCSFPRRDWEIMPDDERVD